MSQPTSPAELARAIETRTGLGPRYGLRDHRDTTSQQWLTVERSDGAAWTPILQVAIAHDYVPIEGERDYLVLAGPEDRTRERYAKGDLEVA